MSHALVTISAPIAVAKIADALRAIEALENPAGKAVAAALHPLEGDNGTHFCSLHAVPPETGSRGHLVLELSADGTEDQAIDRLASQIGPELTKVFEHGETWRGGSLAAHLRAHKVKIGQGWFGEAGLAFAGTPGMSVGRIRKEAALSGFIAGLVENQAGGLTALKRLGLIRDAVGAQPEHAWALTPGDKLLQQPITPTPALIWSLLGSFIATYLWPLLIPAGLVLAIGLVHVATGGEKLVHQSGSWTMAWGWLIALLHVAQWLLTAALLFIGAILAVATFLYFRLRKHEEDDKPSQRLPDLGARSPDHEVLREMVKRENDPDHVQNHMISITLRKPGLTRWLTLRLAFWLILGMASRTFKPGYLANIGTIHFARWVTLPGTRQVVFFSNFGGSWESYLEDFITKAHEGLTAVWSNTVGFPYTRNLLQLGATDGERFKRYARQSMAATPFWYCAYPRLSTDNIRTNAKIRAGLALAKTDEEAKVWLALFGSATRPVAKLESNQIQSLLFGGLSFLPSGRLLLANFAADRAGVRGWLRDIREHVAFDDGRRLKRPAVVTLALGPQALRKAGLSEGALGAFPPAYLEGMRQPGRARILGDRDEELKWWEERDYDAAILVYGKDDKAVADLCDTVGALLKKHGHGAPKSIQLHSVAEKASKQLEGFGFVDGTSQPVIRGTYRGLRAPDPIHLVEPGEFILGYPDNRGNLPPGPELPAAEDPQNLLPIRCPHDSTFDKPVLAEAREVARNGSFLVIRQLEQDRDRFWKYCDEEAKRLSSRLDEPYEISAEFIGAKLIGRWPDGSSLVRNPYQPFTRNELQHPTVRPGANAAGGAAVAAAPAPVQDGTPTFDAKGKPTPPAHGEPGHVAFGAADNDFLFGVEDPEGVRCPFGSHIRRANPRDSLDPGSQDQIDISNRHRILRVGRGYVPDAGSDQKPGLMFMCLNGDLERQFEFVQQTWLNAETFHGLAGERDPLAGHHGGCPAGFTVPTRDGPVRLSTMQPFITPRGGGYFFLPGRRLLEFLGS